jgi:hypothetical protein
VDLNNFPSERQAKITFSGLLQGTKNPSFSPSDYEFASDSNAPTVTFKGYFDGQQYDDSSGVGLVSGNPSNPLELDLTASETVVDTDNILVLSGTPNFRGPVAVLFSKPVSAIEVSPEQMLSVLVPHTSG